VTFGFVIFGAKISYEKRARKTLMKLTTDENTDSWKSRKVQKTNGQFGRFIKLIFLDSFRIIENILLKFYYKNQLILSK